MVLYKESPCHLALWPIELEDGRVTQGSCMAWGCASTSKFIITAIYICLIGSSSLEIYVEVSLGQHHLLLPTSTLTVTDFCYALGIATMTKCFPLRRECCGQIERSSPTLQVSAPLPRHLLTPNPMPLCATPIHSVGGGVVVVTTEFIYLLGVL